MKKICFLLITVSLLCCLAICSACNKSQNKNSSSNDSKSINSIGSEAIGSASMIIRENSTNLNGVSAYEFELSSNEEYYTILNYNGLEAEISVPSTYLGKPVAIIGAAAFYNCNTLIKVTLPFTIKKIDFMAFYNCQELKSVNIPSGVTEIGEVAFKNCRSLESIVLPNGLITIGKSAFESIGIKNITIPDSVQSIGKKAFYQCAALESVIFNKADGWFVASTKDATVGTTLELTIDSNNANYLSKTYSNLFWIND